VARAFAAMPESARLLRRVLPDVVLSVGGYAAGPITLAAWAQGISTAMLEPNSEMGLSNRCLAPLVDRAYTAFGAVERHFSSSRVLRAGVPLRPGFAPRPWSDHGGPVRLLVLGGSQGASALNATLPEVVGAANASFEVIHQCGNAHFDEVCRSYANIGQACVKVVPFVEDMPAAIAWADIVVSRAGASAISEICAIGRASVLIPYPHAAGAHQTKNAMALANAGAAICLESRLATSKLVAQTLIQLANDKNRLQQMSRVSQQLGRPDAAITIAGDLLMLGRTRMLIGRKSRHSVAGSPGAEV
jgi:UDP-N-acetylglucosamine--N-acetylmuramyl-(pentapeptide) pyrophosphoryl-undecaprenol N-acetylglucosamine transferase